MKYNIQKLSDVEIQKVSGGSLEHAEGGLRVFNSILLPPQSFS